MMKWNLKPFNLCAASLLLAAASLSVRADPSASADVLSCDDSYSSQFTVPGEARTFEVRVNKLDQNKIGESKKNNLKPVTIYMGNYANQLTAEAEKTLVLKVVLVAAQEVQTFIDRCDISSPVPRQKAPVPISIVWNDPPVSAPASENKPSAPERRQVTLPPPQRPSLSASSQLSM